MDKEQKQKLVRDFLMECIIPYDSERTDWTNREVLLDLTAESTGLEFFPIREWEEFVEEVLEEEQERVRAVVEGVLVEVDTEKFTTTKAYNLEVYNRAVEKTGIDLYLYSSWKDFVKKVTMEFVHMKMACNASDDDDEDSSQSFPEVKRPPISSISFMIRASSSKTVRHKFTTSQMKKKEQTEDIKEKETSGRTRRKKHVKEASKPNYETDVEGNPIICALSAK